MINSMTMYDFPARATFDPQTLAPPSFRTLTLTTSLPQEGVDLPRVVGAPAQAL